MNTNIEPEYRDGACPRCHGDLKRIWSSKRQKNYWFCQSAEEECGGVFQDREGEPVLRIIERAGVDGIKCPDCAGLMEVVRGTRFGPFYSCANGDCVGTLDMRDQNGEPGPENIAPPCPDHPEHGPMRRRIGRNGTFWGCRKYPSCHSTRQVEVKK